MDRARPGRRCWDWELDVAGKAIPYSVVLHQQFQVIEGAARAGDRREVLTEATLHGDQIAFTLAVTIDGLGLTRHEFAGRVEDDALGRACDARAAGCNQRPLAGEAHGATTLFRAHRYGALRNEHE